MGREEEEERERERVGLDDEFKNWLPGGHLLSLFPVARGGEAGWSEVGAWAVYPPRNTSRRTASSMAPHVPLGGLQICGHTSRDASSWLGKQTH